MIFGAIAMLIGLYLIYDNTIKVYRERKRESLYVDKFDYIAGAVFGLAFSIMGAMLAVMIFALPIGHLTDQPYVENEWDFKIVAVADNTQIEGSFFLFAGSIDEEPVYNFYRQYADGRITQGHLPVDRTSIYETADPDSAHVTVVERNDNFDWWRVRAKQPKQYEVHLPPGSVVRQFNLDLN